MNNLGIALGAYTNEMNRQREQQRADAADQRQQQQFDLQMQEAERVKGIRSQRESMVNELKAYRAALDNPYDERNFALLRDGAKKHGYGDLTRMGGTLGVFTGGEQGVPQFKPLNPEDFKAQINSAMMDQLVYADADQVMPYLQNQANYAKDERRWQAGQLTEKQKLDMEERKLQAQIPLINAQAGYYNRMPRAAGGGGGRGDPYGMTDEEASALNQAIEYEEVAKQLARTNPAAAQQYRLAAVEAMRSVRPRTQLAMRAKFGASPQEAVDDWDRPVKVKRATDQGEIEMNVPLRVADPEGYARYLREQQAAMFMPEPGSSFFGDKASAKPQNAVAEQPALNVDEQREMRRLKAIAELEELRRRTGNPEAGRGLPTIVPSVTLPSINFNDLQGRTNGPLNNYGAGR